MSPLALSPITFSFAPSGINITRALCELLEVIKPSGLKNDSYQQQIRPYWHLLQDENMFHRLYAYAFSILDDVFVEEQATYMMFPKVLQLTKARLNANITTDQDNLPAMLRPLPLLSPSSSYERRPPVQAMVVDDGYLSPPAFDSFSSNYRGSESNLGKVVVGGGSYSSSNGGNSGRRSNVISI